MKSVIYIKLIKSKVIQIDIILLKQWNRGSYLFYLLL